MKQNDLFKALEDAASTDSWQEYTARVCVIRRRWCRWSWLIDELELPADCFFLE